MTILTYNEPEKTIGISDNTFKIVIVGLLIIFFPSPQYILNIGPSIPVFVYYIFIFLQIFCILGLMFIILVSVDSRNERKIFLFFLSIYMSIFLILYVYLGEVFSPFADQDESIMDGAKNLISFQNPYEYPTSTLNNPKSPFPGIFLLFIPIVILNIPYIVASLIAFIALLILFFKEGYNGEYYYRLCLIVAFQLIPIVTQAFLYHFDFFFFGLLHILSLKFLYEEKLMKSSLIYGLLLASRQHYYLFYGSVIVYVYLLHGLKPTINYISVSLGLAIVVIVPFMLLNPEIFFKYAPLGNVGSKFSTAPFFILFDFYLSNPYFVAISLCIFSVILSLFMKNFKQLILIHIFILFLMNLILRMGTRFEMHHLGYLIIPVFYLMSRTDIILSENNFLSLLDLLRNNQSAKN